MPPPSYQVAATTCLSLTSVRRRALNDRTITRRGVAANRQRIANLVPTAHRFDWWRRRLLFATPGRSFALVARQAASARRYRWLRGKPLELVGKRALCCPTTGLGRHCPAMLPTG